MLQRPQILRQENPWPVQGRIDILLFWVKSQMQFERSQQKKTHFRKEHFLNVTHNQQSGQGKNIGFIFQNNTMCMYIQMRDSLSYFSQK